MSPRTGCPLALVAALGCHSPLAATTAGEATDATTGAASSSGSVTGDMTEGTWAIGLELGVDRGALFGVWGPAPDEVYAVGGTATEWQLAPPRSAELSYRIKY